MTAIDTEVLKQLEIMLGEDSPEFLQELISDFLKDARGLMDKIQDAIAQDSAPGLRHAAHTLKSNSAMFGAHNFSQTCKALEYLGASGSTQGAVVMFSSLQQQFVQVCQELEMARV